MQYLRVLLRVAKDKKVERWGEEWKDGDGVGTQLVGAAVAASADLKRRSNNSAVDPNISGTTRAAESSTFCCRRAGLDAADSASRPAHRPLRPGILASSDSEHSLPAHRTLRPPSPHHIHIPPSGDNLGLK